MLTKKSKIIFQQFQEIRKKSRTNNLEIKF